MFARDRMTAIPMRNRCSAIRNTIWLQAFCSISARRMAAIHARTGRKLSYKLTISGMYVLNAFRTSLRIHQKKTTRMSSLELSEQEIQRRSTLDQIRNAGIEPYPAELYPVTHLSSDIKNNFEEGT